MKRLKYSKTMILIPSVKKLDNVSVSCAYIKFNA